jgi:hypothetical protein
LCSHYLAPLCAGDSCAATSTSAISTSSSLTSATSSIASATTATTRPHSWLPRHWHKELILCLSTLVTTSVSLLLGIWDEGPASFPQRSLTTRQRLRRNDLITLSWFSISRFAGCRSYDQRQRPGPVAVVDEGMPEMKGRRPCRDGNIKGVAAPEARNRRRCETRTRVDLRLA